MSHQFAQVDKVTNNITGWFLQHVAPPEDEVHFYARINPHYSSAESPRPSRNHILRLVDGKAKWVDNAPIEDRRKLKAEMMSLACRDHIEGGFISNALGAPFLYPAKPHDQVNLFGSVIDSLLFATDPNWTTPFWCANEQGEWAFRPHTRAQIQRVGRQGKMSILAAMQRNDTLQAQIMTADASGLENIKWSTE